MKKNNECAHCGLPSIQKFAIDNVQFCCQGCQSVYQLLNESGFSDYYTIEKKPGTAQDKKLDYVFLKEENIVKNLLEYYDDEKQIITLSLPQIHCNACIWLLEQVDQFVEGVKYSRVNFTQQSLRVIYNPHQITLFELVEKLHKIGYPPRITMNANPTKEAEFISNSEKKQRTGQLIRLGAAGFFFGNSMFISLPEYFDTLDDMSPQIIALFSILNIIFGGIALLWCGQEFFKKSMLGLRQKKISIDVPIVIGATVIYVESVMKIFLFNQTGYIDSLTGLLFFLLLGRWFQNKTFRNINFNNSFEDMFPFAVQIKKNNHWNSQKIEDIQPDDEIRILKYGIIPTDATLKDDSCFVDYSNLTGESHPVLTKKNDYIFAGGILLSDTAQFLVKKSPKKSYLVDILTTPIKKKSTNNKNVLDHIAKYFSIIILCIASISSLIWYFYIDADRALHIFVSILIVACPCALSLSLPVTNGITQRLLSKVGFFLKNSSDLQLLSKIKHLVFDKTGTLTDKKEFSVQYKGTFLNDEHIKIVYNLCQQSNHPFSQSICHYYSTERDSPLEKMEFESFKEVIGHGLVGNFDNNVYSLGAKKFVQTDDNSSNITNKTTTNKNEKQATTTLKKGNDTDYDTDTEERNSTVYLSINKKVVGSFIIYSSFKKGIFSCLQSLKNKFELSLISGDNDSSEPILSPYFHDTRFYQNPEQKFEYIHKLENSMMIGDGINDSQALAGAQLGMVVSDNIQNFNPAAQIILEGRQIIHLNSLLKFCRRSQQTVIFAVIYSFFYNLIGIGLAIYGLFSPFLSAILMPLSSISIVIFITLKSFFDFKKELNL